MTLCLWSCSPAVALAEGGKTAPIALRKAERGSFVAFADLLVIAWVVGLDIADDVAITKGRVIEAEAWVVVGDGAEAGTGAEAGLLEILALAADRVADLVEGEATLITILALTVARMVIKAEAVASFLTETTEVRSVVLNVVETEVVRFISDGRIEERLGTECVTGAE